MSKLIVEMEMPKDLAVIVTILPDGRIFKHLGYKDKKQIGKIVGVLPEEHGDLIDRDIMYKQIQLWKSTATDTTTMGFMYHFEKLLMSARPIIAAERKDE